MAEPFPPARLRSHQAHGQRRVAVIAGSGKLGARPGLNAVRPHPLDLVTRRFRLWATLRLATILPTYDGGVVTVVDEDGVALIDVLPDQPRVLWRELDREHRVLRINRTPTRLTGLIDVPPALPGGSRTEQLWAWELPSMTLRVPTRSHSIGTRGGGTTG
ncbi:MAG TPA: hypothetical protein VGL39_24410 [Jatrophihabitantaceae bacterium]